MPTARSLQRHWRTVDPEMLDEVAADLWADARLRGMAPAEAATDWLRPAALDDGHPGRHRLVD